MISRVRSPLLVLGSVLTLCGGCSQLKRREAPRPYVDCGGCDAHEAFVPGTAFDVTLGWEGSCEYEDFLPDMGHTESCDEQPVRASLTVHGAPCVISPEPLSGMEFEGNKRFRVTSLAPGDLRLAAELEHRVSGKRYHTEILVRIRNPDRLVIECRWDSDPKLRSCEYHDGFYLCAESTWKPCPAAGALERDGGNPIAIWVYAEAQGQPVYAIPEVSFNGFTPQSGVMFPPHPRPEAVAESLEFSTQVTQPGTYSIEARRGVLRSSLSFTLQ